MSLWKIVLLVRPHGKREWKTMLASTRATGQAAAIQSVTDSLTENYEVGRIVEATELKDDDEGF